jgi:hypothetical protein
LFSICLVGLNPSHLIKSNVLNNDILHNCNSNKWCYENNKTILCPLYSLICNKSTNDLCSSDGHIKNVRIEQGVPGLKNWQLSGELNFYFISFINSINFYRKSFFSLST